MADVDSIYARASAPGRAGVSVYRISGNGVIAIATSLLGRVPKPRMAELVTLKSKGGRKIDQALVLFFPGPNSFTGEDTLELHCHGSRAVELDLYDVLGGLGARLAERGEFTLRAMKNGKMDLPKVEALADIIDSETIQQKNLALRQLEGRLSGHVSEWRSLLLKILTPLAADIDFPDEEDVPAAISANALPVIGVLREQLQEALRGAEIGRRIREGFQIVLLGPTNAGKSSLMNLLVGSDMAIVSDQPGTTRDIIEARLDIGGMAVTLSDTAGLREHSDDAIEMEGMRRTRDRGREADLRILVLDGMTVSRETIDREALNNAYGLRADDLIIFNKMDLWDGRISLNEETALNGQAGSRLALPINMSAKSGYGLELLTQAIAEKLDINSSHKLDGLLNRERHSEAVSMALEALERAEANVIRYPELAAEDLRLANRAFNRLVGAVDVEEILGEVFSSFCIGK